jgi:hypothetical protein
MDCKQVWEFSKSILNFLLEQLPGMVVSLATSFYVAQMYFKRQRRIDELKEKKEVELAHKRLINAYVKSLGKRPKGASFAVHEAMSELRAKLEIYRPDFDANKWLKDASQDALKFIVEHAGDLEDIPKNERN